MEFQESLLTDIEATEVEASHGQRILSNIIDLVLEIGLLLILYMILPGSIRAFLIKNKPVSTYLFILVLFSVYRLMTILLLQRTVGMMICNCKYLNETFQPLSSSEKLVATFAPGIKKIKIYKGSQENAH